MEFLRTLRINVSGCQCVTFENGTLRLFTVSTPRNSPRPQNPNDISNFSLFFSSLLKIKIADKNIKSSFLRKLKLAKVSNCSRFLSLDKFHVDAIYFNEFDVEKHFPSRENMTYRRDTSVGNIARGIVIRRRNSSNFEYRAMRTPIDEISFFPLFLCNLERRKIPSISYSRSRASPRSYHFEDRNS